MVQLFVVCAVHGEACCNWEACSTPMAYWPIVHCSRKFCSDCFRIGARTIEAEIKAAAMLRVVSRLDCLAPQPRKEFPQRQLRGHRVKTYPASRHLWQFHL